MSTAKLPLEAPLRPTRLADVPAREIPIRVTRRLWTACRRLGWRLKAAPRCAKAWWRNRTGESAYIRLSAAQLRATRKRDVAFIFGSGYSLKDITQQDWARIALCDTISFNQFPRQSFVRADYHLAAEIHNLEGLVALAARIAENQLYANTVFVVQGGWPAHTGNELIGRRLLPIGAPVYRYRRTARERCVPPSRELPRLVHGYGTLFDVVNFAYVMGWSDIVLAGVDMYDKRYFWLQADEVRSWDKPGTTADTPFHSGKHIVGMMGYWRSLLEAENVRLWVYNPKSLLARVMPVWSWPGQGHDVANA